MHVGEFALAHAEPREIEAQYANATHRQPLGNAFGREIILPASEAMREQRESGRLAEREIDQRRQLLAFGIGKIEPLGAHGVPFSLVMPRPRYSCAGYGAPPTRPSQPLAGRTTQWRAKCRWARPCRVRPSPGSRTARPRNS